MGEISQYSIITLINMILLNLRACILQKIWKKENFSNIFGNKVKVAFYSSDNN